MFDPHGTHLKGGILGLKASFLEWKGKYDGHLDPFILPMVGSTMHGPLEGTLFRLPLRDERTTSLLSSLVYSHQDMIDLLVQFGQQAAEMLLYDIFV